MGAPTGLTASVSGRDITARWTPGDGATSQVPVVVNVADDTDYCLGALSSDASSYTCADLTEGATYVVMVIALGPGSSTGYRLSSILRVTL